MISLDAIIYDVNHLADEDRRACYRFVTMIHTVGLKKFNSLGEAKLYFELLASAVSDFSDSVQKLKL